MYSKNERSSHQEFSVLRSNLGTAVSACKDASLVAVLNRVSYQSSECLNFFNFIGEGVRKFLLYFSGVLLVERLPKLEKNRNRKTRDNHLFSTVHVR